MRRPQSSFTACIVTRRYSSRLPWGWEHGAMTGTEYREGGKQSGLRLVSRGWLMPAKPLQARGTPSSSMKSCLILAKDTSVMTLHTYAITEEVSQEVAEAPSNRWWIRDLGRQGNWGHRETPSGHRGTRVILQLDLDLSSLDLFLSRRATDTERQDIGGQLRQHGNKNAGCTPWCHAVNVTGGLSMSICSPMDLDLSTSEGCHMPKDTVFHVRATGVLVSFFQWLLIAPAPATDMETTHQSS